MQEGIFCGKQNDFRGPSNGHKQCFGANVGKKSAWGKAPQIVPSGHPLIMTQNTLFVTR